MGLLLLLRGGPQPAVDVRTGGPVGLISSALVAPGMSMIGARAGCRYLEEVPAYLRSVRGGRDADPELVAEFQRRYRLIGWSPLVRITLEQGAELQRLLARGAEKARKASEPTLEAMYEHMGFVKPELGRFFGAARPRSL